MINNLDPNSLFDLNENIDSQMNYLTHLSSEKCTQNAINSYMRRNLNYPILAKKNSIEGKIIVSYTINTEGSVTEVEVVFGKDKYLKEEAIRLVSNLPRFNPVKKRGKPISTKGSMPINFILQ